MASTITSNNLTVTVAGTPSYTYSLSLTASPSSFGTAGGTTTLTTVYSSTPVGGQVSGLTVTFTETTTGTTTTGITNSSGAATASFTLPGNSQTTATVYSFEASITANGTTTTSNTVTVSVAEQTYLLSLTATSTSLPDTGGSTSLEASLQGTTPITNANLSGVVITFYNVNTGAVVGTATTNSEGGAAISVTLPANSTTTAESYIYDAVATL